MLLYLEILVEKVSFSTNTLTIEIFQKAYKIDFFCTENMDDDFRLFIESMNLNILCDSGQDDDTSVYLLFHPTIENSIKLETFVIPVTYYYVEGTDRSLMQRNMRNIISMVQEYLNMTDGNAYLTAFEIRLLIGIF